MKLFKASKKQHFKNQSGNAILAIFAAVAVIGTLGGSAAILIRGPLKTMGEVNQTTMTEGYLFSAGKMVLLDAENWVADGDCDNDRIVEPRPWRAAGALPAPAGGGLIPNEIGSMKRDPWGTQIGYCGWDHGSLINGVTATGDECTDVNRLQGTNRRDYPAVAVVSAGPNKTFDSTCNDYIDVGPADGEADTPLFVPGGDDMYVVYSYAEAAQELPNIWREDSPDIWSLNIEGGSPELVTTDDVEFSGSDIFAPTRMEMVGQLGLLLPDETELTTCTVAEEGQLRRNMGGATPILEMCETGAFAAVSGGSGSSYSALKDSVNIVGPKDGLVGYWRLDETSGTDVIDSIGDNNGEMKGAMTGENSTRVGQVGTSLYMNSHIEISNNYNMAAFTMCIWTHFEQTAASTSTIVSAGGGTAVDWVVHFRKAPDKIQVIDSLSNSGDITTIETSVVQDRWYHICAGVNESGNSTFYLNGRLIDDSTAARGVWSNLPSTSNIKIGRNPGGFRALNGYVDDFRLYSRSLSLNEVQAIYNKDNYITHATVEQTASSSDTIDSYGLSLLFSSDTAGETGGIAFKIDDALNPLQPPSAAIVASRITTPARTNLLFKTYAETSGYQTRAVLDYNGRLLIGDSTEAEADLQIGDYVAGWNNDYTQGILATNDGYTDSSITFFGDKQTDDASAQLLFSNILRLQHTDVEGSTLSEYLRFSSSAPKIRAFGDIEINEENADTALRIQKFSNTASEYPEFTFQRSDGGTRLPTGFNVGNIQFRGYDGSNYTAGSNAIIQAFITSGYSNGALPPTDLRFETRPSGFGGMEHLRIKGPTGQVGFNKATPEAKFHVGGRQEVTEGVIIGDDSVCNSARDTGTLRYRSGAFEICNGSDWIDAGGDPSDSVCKGLPFDFTDRDSLTASTNYDTNSILIGGIKGACPLTVTSNSANVTLYQNGSAVSNSFTTVRNGDRIHLQIQTSANVAEHISADIHMGEQHDSVDFQTVGKIVFVTSVSSNGNFGGTNGGFSRCNNLAKNAGLKGHFMPWLSDSNISPNRMFRRYDNAYHLVNETVVANDWTDLTDGNIDNHINIDENGDTDAADNIWTGTNTAGNAIANRCNDWNDRAPSTGWMGENHDLAGWTTGGSNRGCNWYTSFYCFEQ